MRDRTYNNAEESRLIEGLKQGDSLAFEAIYRMYFQRLYLYCRQFTKSRQDAQDIVQEVFVKLWQQREVIRHQTTIRGLLFMIARNAIVASFRKNVSSPMLVDYMEYVNSIGLEDVGGVEFKEFEYHLMKAIDELSPSRKNIILLSRFEHLSNKEIAMKLGINEQSVKNSISQSLVYIRKRLKEVFFIIITVFLWNLLK